MITKPPSNRNKTLVAVEQVGSGLALIHMKPVLLAALTESVAALTLIRRPPGRSNKQGVLL